MLSGGTQRRALALFARVKILINNNLFPRVRIEPTTSHVYSHTLAPLRYDWPR